MVPGVPCVDRGNWGQDFALCEYSVLARIGPCTLMSHTDMSIVFGRGRSTNYSCLKASQVSRKFTLETFS